jgi:hypothetical protein
MAQYKDDLYGKEFTITGIVEEHLKYASQEWVKLRFDDGSTHLINLKYCEEVKDENDA